MNLEKYVDAFCFSNGFISESGDKLFYLWQKAGEKKLYYINTNQTSFTEGSLVFDKDFSDGSFAIDHYDEKRNLMYLVLDVSNKENFNLWKLDLNSKTLIQLTHLEYTAGITYNEDSSLGWCYSKKKLADGTFESDVYQINFSTSEVTFLFSDVGQDYRIGWTPMASVPGSDHFVFTLDYLNQRKKTNVCLYSLSKKEWKKLLPEDLEEKGNPSVFEENPDADGVLIESVHEGFQNIYFCSFKDGQIRKITDLSQKNEGINVVLNNNKKMIRAVVKKGETFFLELYNNKEKVKSIELPHLIYLFKTKKDIWGILTSPDSTNKIIKLDESGKILKSIEMTSFPATELEHTISSWVSYSSFDGKEIKAILHMPKTELKAVSVIAFYGGEEYYSRYVQMYAEMGIATLSPAVRGSWGWGREWEKMLEGDLGGNEILDVIWAGKYLESKLNLPSTKVGVHGGSHGGYATLRAITMPANYNGLKETYYPFGFAISNVGFADLMAFYRDSRIADWLVHLLGQVNEEKYLERSPLSFFENLNTPLLVINGKNDSRVPFSSIEKFIEKLENSSKEFELLIHTTQGHGTSSRETTMLEYETEVKFLKRFL